MIFLISFEKTIFIIFTMDESFTRNILNPTLKLIKEDIRVKRFYFFPWLLSVLFISVLLVYQVVYTYSVLLWKEDVTFELILNLFHSAYITQMLIAAGVFIICYILLVPVFEGWLIKYIDTSITSRASRSDSIWHGILRFAPLFEFNNIFNMFKLMSIINWFLFSVRFLGIEYIYLLSVIFFIAFLFSIVINILTAYATYEIVLENKWVFEAIGTSSQLAMVNIKTTIKLYILMFVMNLKVIINFAVFLIFPILWGFIIGFLSSQIFITITFIVLWVMFVSLILLLWYIASVLEVFTTSIWYNAYREWKHKLEQTSL